MPRTKKQPSTAEAPVREPGELTESVSVQIALDLAMGDNESVYHKRHLELRLDRRQSGALRRVYDAANAAGVRLRNGRYVQNNVDAVRLILDRIADAAPGS